MTRAASDTRPTRASRSATAAQASAVAADAWGAGGFLGRYRLSLLWLLIGIVGLLGFEAVRTILAEVHLKDIRAALHTIRPDRVALAGLLTAASYLALTLYDWCAVRTIGRSLPWRTAALASFTSYTLSHNLGFSLLTGGSARFRAYSAAGLDFADIARITVVASATFWAGVFTVAAIALLSAQAPLASVALQLDPTMQRLAGGLLLLGLAAIFGLRLSGISELRWRRSTVPLPGARLMLAQIGIAALDLACASAALFVLVPHASVDALGAFFLAYVLAIIVGLLTHVPGGIGVFEATILALVPGSRSDVFAALLLYRMIYYLLPLGLAGAITAILEAHRLRRPLAIGFSVLEQVGQAFAPSLIALLVFGGGLVLLVSGALPAEHGRIDLVGAVLPLPFVEASHFAASLVGTALLLLAPAVQARLRSGFHLARALLIGGALFSLLKGFDYEEAIVLTFVAALLQYSRPAFHRSAGIGAAPFASWWWAAALIGLALSIWAGFFAYKHVPYSGDLWWDFTWRGNAPRFLRATLGASIAIGAFAFWRLVSAPTALPRLRSVPDQVAARALAAAQRSDAMLAFTGDKDFLVSAAQDAFLMYRVQGRTWVVMGDPVGPVAAWSELVWEIRRRCDAAHGRLCFYQASTEMLPLLVELGLQPMKYGEEALVDLSAGFTLAGAQFKSLRHSVNKAEASGLRFGIVPAAEVAAMLPELRRVSDAWLAGKADREKSFSLGRFDAAYLARFDCAVLRRGGEIAAFANLWQSCGRVELSVDLMRHRPDAPYGAMDLLFVRLMQWGAGQGYRRFNLGLAPLSGLNAQPLAPIWSRAGAAIYGHGERLYGFSGLRAFKAKFGPQWVPRYVATSPGLSAPRALLDLTSLVAG